MGEFNFTVHDSKLFYAMVCQAAAVGLKIQDYKTNILGAYFPAISTEWGQIKKILQCGIQSKIAWSGMSMTKSDTVPDETRAPPEIAINENIIRLMKKKATDLSVTLSSDFEFFDESAQFAQAHATWSAACKAYLDIIGWSQEMALYKNSMGELESGNATVTRSGAQLMMFDQCDVPIADGSKWYSAYNWEGLEAGFGSTFYANLLLETVDVILDGTIPDPDRAKQEVVADKLDDPDNPGVKTIYNFAAMGGYALAGVIYALDSDGDYHTTGVTYLSGTSGKLTINTPVGSAPATTTFKLLGLK